MQEKFENIINNMVYYYIPREYAMKSRTGMAKPDGKAAIAVDVRVGDILTMKKKHPCGENRFLVLRSGMDFRIRCTGCGHELMVPRPKCEKNIKSILHIAIPQKENE